MLTNFWLGEVAICLAICRESTRAEWGCVKRKTLHAPVVAIVLEIAVVGLLCRMGVVKGGTMMADHAMASNRRAEMLVCLASGVQSLGPVV
jgi:hypothetical protein